MKIDWFANSVMPAFKRSREVEATLRNRLIPLFCLLGLLTLAFEPESTLAAVINLQFSGSNATGNIDGSGFTGAT